MRRSQRDGEGGLRRKSKACRHQDQQFPRLALITMLYDVRRRAKLVDLEERTLQVRYSTKWKERNTEL